VICDVERPVVPCEAGRRIEIIQKDQSRFRGAVTVLVAKQDHLIGGLPASTGPAHQKIGNPCCDPASVLRRCTRQGNEDIAIGQGLQGSRVLQSVSKALDLQALGSRRDFIRLPSDRFGDGNRREGFCIRLVETRLCSDDFIEGNVRRIAARDEVENDRQDGDYDQEGDAQFFENAHALKRYASKSRAATPLASRAAWPRSPRCTIFARQKTARNPKPTANCEMRRTH